MRLVFVLFLLSAFALTDGAQFLSPLPDGTVVYACAARSVTLSWQYVLSTGDQINHVRWYYEGSHNTLIAYYSRGSFLPLPAFATRVEFVSNGGLQLRNLSVSDSGKYFVEISGIDRNLALFQHQRHVLLYVADGLRTTNGRLAVSLQKDPILDTTTGEWSMVLSCGRFTYSGQPAFPIEWVTPSGRGLWSTKYESGYFKLHLTTSSVEGGRYVCRVPTSYTTSACLSYSQAAAEQVGITVDKVDAQLTITNAELRLLKQKDASLTQQSNSQQSEIRSLTQQSNAQQSEIRSLTQQSNTQQSEIRSLTQRVVAEETESRSLRTSLSSLSATHQADTATLSGRINDAVVPLVTFHARTTISLRYTNVYEHLKFNEVINNHGNGYSYVTGEFTAPVSGTYYFSFQAQNYPGYYAYAFVYVNGQYLCEVYVDSRNTYEGASCSGIRYLVRGQKAWVQSMSNSNYFYLYRTAFTGFLINDGP